LTIKEALARHESNPDTRFLLQHLLRLSWSELVRQGERRLTPDEERQFRDGCRRLADDEPLAYIIGTAEFFGAVFYVDPRVLIPRPETESIVEWVLQEMPAAVDLLDLGTGSGCLGLSILRLNPRARLTAVDISRDALDVAEINALEHNLRDRVTFVEKSVEELDFKECFDVVIANPPYIARDDTDVAPSVRKYEPPTALFADDQGLGALRVWIPRAIDALRVGGRIYFEIGWKQGKAVREMAQRDSRWGRVEIRHDVFGRERFLVAQRER
jgi:release factor glutamine methyltransferase